MNYRSIRWLAGAIVVVAAIFLVALVSESDDECVPPMTETIDQLTDMQLIFGCLDDDLRYTLSLRMYHKFGYGIDVVAIACSEKSYIDMIADEYRSIIKEVQAIIANSEIPDMEVTNKSAPDIIAETKRSAMAHMEKTDLSKLREVLEEAVSGGCLIL
ncbi:MAG: hypothetical protein ISN28_15500 [Ectothiorhodospiraceae bacterium AqS1]|nr:hypothetical protein [Ectothiorhodospiraceae bacterium AqS1]MBF2761637.1 hypothetical protein [Ectothiorhodospiraceae bacterium AqS1]